ncbi:MAG: GUN4 domain-containing protein [Crocosphaera sp.]|nr:GUN4 domain-containing protein [Crocosphaera sp.]
MVRAALLVGVSEGIDPLNEPINDIEAIREVLQEPTIGEFDTVTVLPNPKRSQLEIEIYQFFSNREANDTLLFYFSGHGLRDNYFKFYLATSNTEKDNKGSLIPPTAVAATYLQKQITNSRSNKQVIILDCCFSEAFVQGMKVKGDLEIEAELGGTGRAILVSSSNKQFSFEEKNSELSIYTRYLVEGLKTGAAALPGYQWITPKGLHEYVSKKVLEAAPAMTPKFYNIDEGLDIYLAHSPQNDPKLQYRIEATKKIRKGKISSINRRYLNRLYKNLKLTEEEAKTIELSILKPYQEYQQKLKEYQDALSEFLEQETTLTDTHFLDLKDFQNLLGLRDEDVEPIHQKLISPPPKTHPPIPSPTSEIELKSEKGVDYSKLRDLLAEGRWRAADQETAIVILQVANRVSEGWLRVEDIDNFPCDDLRTIDQLWVHYSKGKFGFSVQKKIYVDELGGTRDYNGKIWYKFCDRVGWREGGSYVSYSDLTFELLDTTPMGHLPSMYCMEILLVFSRAKTCKL